MVYQLDDRKVFLAVDCIIKDTDKKFDECLVDRFLKFIESQVREGDETFAMLDRVKSYMDHRSFVMLNQARAFKTFHSILNSIKLNNSFGQILPYLDSLWNTLDVIVLNHSLSAMTVMLAIFNNIALSGKQGWNWLFDKTVDPPLVIADQSNMKLRSEIRDISSLLKFYIRSTNNYHTRNQAENLLKTLITNSHFNELSHQLLVENLIRKLIIEGSPSIFHILIKTYEDTKLKTKEIFQNFKIHEIIEENLQFLFEQRNLNTNNVCKCLGLANPKDGSSDIILEELKSRDKLEAIIIYIACLYYDDFRDEKLLLTYLLYPVLKTCSGGNSKILIEELATRDERNFIDKNVNNKLVTSCLVQLNQIFAESNIHLQRLSQKTLLMAVQILTDYIRFHHASMEHYKSVRECCSVLYRLQSMGRLDKDTLLHSLRGTLSVIEDNDSSQSKSILLEMLKVMRSTHYQFSKLKDESLGRNELNSLTVDLAFKYSDHDIMNEIVQIFILNRFDFKQERKDVEKYVELVWKHIYLNAKDTEHRELLGNIAQLLIEIDLEAEASILAGQNIRRYHEIPKLLGDILIDRSAILPTVERTIDALISPNWLLDTDSTFNRTIGYVCRLDSPNLSSSVREGLDHLARGLCVTARGETAEETRLKALQLINDLIAEIITNYDDSASIIKRLSRTGILETLYEIITASMYSSSMYELAQARIGLLKIGVISKLSDPSEMIVNQLVSSKERGKTWREARLVAEFYTDKADHIRMIEDSFTQVGDEMESSSLVDDILNYELISDGILDCY